MDAAFVLVHSPSVGPATWQPVAERLPGPVVVPSLLDVADSAPPFWPRVVDLVRAAVAELPAGQRVSPADAVKMARIITSGANIPAIMTLTGAHHYKFIGIEVAPVNDQLYLRELVRFGSAVPSEQGSLADVPHDLVIDRCYLHSYPNHDMIRAIALNSAA